MKQKIINIALCLFFLAGLSITLYPVFSDWYISRHQGQVVDNYDKKAAEMSQKEISKALEKAREYNRKLLGNVVLTDPFDPDAVERQNEDYDNLLNIAGDGVMGAVEIPSIDVYLPIYHGTDSKALEKGAGHLENSSLPVGGKGTHSIISAHTGLPSAKMFDNITEVKEGDIFYIHVLNRILAYEVNQIKVVFKLPPDLLQKPGNVFLDSGFIICHIRAVFQNQICVWSQSLIIRQKQGKIQGPVENPLMAVVNTVVVVKMVSHDLIL
mgnify:CR=1 FL=1